MFDDYYSLDEILSEAKRIKEQKVYGAHEDDNTPPIIPAQGQRVRPVEAPRQEYGSTFRQPAPEAPAAAAQGNPQGNVPAIQNHTQGNLNPAYIEPPVPKTEPRPANAAPSRGFSMARGSEVFGAYQNADSRTRPEPPPPASREVYPSEHHAAYYPVPPVREPQPYTPPAPQPAPSPAWQEPPVYTPPPVQQPARSVEYEPAPPRPPAEPYQPPMPQQVQTPSEPSGFRLRRPARPQAESEQLTPPPSAEPTAENRGYTARSVGGAPQAAPAEQASAVLLQDQDTKQFETITPDMETANELAGVNPLVGRQLTAVPPQESVRMSRWQSYQMLEQDGDLPDEEEPKITEDFEADENELNSPEDVPNVLRRLRTRHILALLRTAALSVTSAGAIYLILSRIAVTLPVPDLINAQKAPGMYALALFALSFVSFLVSIMPISHGLLSLFRLKANTDSMTAIAAVSTLVYTFAFVARPSMLANPNAQYYCVVAIIGLWFNALGKVMILSRIRHNLSVAGSGERLYAIKTAESGEFARSVVSVMDEQEPKVAVAAPTGFLKGFMHFSYDDEQAQGASRILSPICFGAAAVLSAASYFLYKDLLSCFTVFTAVVCVCAPFTSVAVINLPLLRAAKSLTPRGAMLTGGGAAEELAEATSVAVNAAELFPTGSITLHGIRTFKGGRIDMSILEAASIMEKVGGTMADIFYQIIEGRKEILEDVDDIVYEEGMGISAWVNGNRVLIGNRELMRHHGVELPPREYELKYTQEGRDLMYLATSGELASMFVISYHADPAVYRHLKRLERSGVAVLVKSTDPNITRDMLSDLFELDYDMVRIMPASLHGAYTELTAEQPAGLAAAATMGGAQAMMDTVLAAVKVKSSSAAASMIQMLFIILGYGLATLFTFFYGISLINPLLLLSYQLVSALVVTLFISARSY